MPSWVNPSPPSLVKIPRTSQQVVHAIRTPKTRKLPGFIQASLSPTVVPDGGGLKLNGVS
ncbi:hypothetical protein D7X12_16145 [Corallococcus sicarius]|uniref:Uncharacterized protein n=1 Tax=Corallococcus sicarius TaxID=2316726 RepID=A0A3A8ND44_9BACT|nr:hypothetical protein D7X12_16145 [Corallococcus sicarius]